MAGVDVIHIIKERERPAPAIATAQIPDRATLEQQAAEILATYEALRLEEPDSANADLAEGPTDSDEQEVNDQIADLLRAAPELEQYLQHPKGLFAELHALDRALQKAVGVNDGLVDDCAGATLVMAARATEHCDALFGAGEALINDPTTAVAVSERLDRHLLPASANVAELAAQIQARRQRDARRTQQREEALRLRESALAAKTRLAELREAEAPGALPPRDGKIIH